MIITVTEVQEILGIDGQADEILKMIPLAESYSFSFTRNYFHTGAIVSSAYFHDNKIEIEMNDIVLQKGNFIHITNSILNNGFYQITDIADNVLTLGSGLQNEQNSNVIFYVCKIPVGYKIALAKYIGSLINGTGTGSEKTSEKIGDYSYTIASTSDLLFEYFNPYKKAVVS